MIKHCVTSLGENLWMRIRSTIPNYLSCYWPKTKTVYLLSPELISPSLDLRHLPGDGRLCKSYLTCVYVLCVLCVFVCVCASACGGFWLLPGRNLVKHNSLWGKAFWTSENAKSDRSSWTTVLVKTNIRPNMNHGKLIVLANLSITYFYMYVISNEKFLTLF